MANEYLKRTPTSTGNRKVWTFSAWVKHSAVERMVIFGSRNDSTTPYTLIRTSSPTINWEFSIDAGTAGDFEGVKKDVASWYNLVVTIDTTLEDDADRIRYYVNGKKLNYSSTQASVTKNTELNVNEIRQHVFGVNPGYSQYWKGEILDAFLVDGQALTPDVFGFYKVGKGYISAGSAQATDFRPGQWVPKTPRVIKTAINNNGGFGVNGFYLPMNDSNNFGADFHGTPNSIIKLQENLPQPRCRIDGVGDYTGALRDDPFKQYLVLALPFVSGGLQSGFGDYSAAIKGSGSAKTGTIVGSPSIGNTASYYGSAGNFIQSNSRITFPSSSDFDFGTGDFTVEFWFNSRNVSASAGAGAQQLGFFQTSDTAGGLKTSYASGILIVQGVGPSGSTNGRISATLLGTSVGTDTAIITTNQWNHCALVRKTGTSTLYVNGVAVGINTTTTAAVSGTNLVVGGYYDTNYLYDGYMQDFRIYKGVAKYTGGFDVPRPYTPVGIESWRAVPDTTANNFATWNAVQNSMSLTDGNLTCTGTGSNQEVYSTIGITTGKWYVEARTNVGTYNHFGVRANSTATYATDYRLIARDDGNVYGDTSQGLVGTLSSGYASAGSIVAMAIDGNLGQITYYVNGVNVGGPYSIYQYNSSSLPTPYKIYNLANSGHGLTVNFGQNPTFS